MYVVGLGAGGAVVAALGLQTPKLPVEMSREQMGLATFLSALVVVLGLVPLAVRQRGVWLARWLTLAVFAYVSLGLNTAIEASIFTRMGGLAAQVLVFVVPVVAMGAAVVCLFGSSRDAEPFGPRAQRFLRARRPSQWVWRLPVAVLSFPVMFWVFGMLLMAIRPGLMEYYRNGAMGLVVPPPGVILSVEVLRSCLFLAAALPVMILWDGSRLGLALALGLALTALVGLSGMAAATWMPTEMRIGHGLEITADSFAHAAVLVWLLVPRRPTVQTAEAKASE